MVSIWKAYMSLYKLLQEVDVLALKISVDPDAITKFGYLVSTKAKLH